MAIRPVDLQQVVVRATDVGRDSATPQQAAAAQQSHTAEQARRHERQAETVQTFEEAGAVLVRERQARSGQQDEPDKKKDQQAADEEGKTADVPFPGAVSRPPLGRHVDLQI